MAKKTGGGLASFVNNATKIADKGNETITYIPIDKLIPNKDNFYGLRNVESLAGLISLSKHIEPLSVIPREDGNYTIISGHRRRAAVAMLIEKEGWAEKNLPCIVLRPQTMTFNQDDGTEVTFSEEQVQLFQLIASNRGQRDERTLDEKRQEIRILEPFAEAIFAQKREEGYRGVFRDFFAEEILSVSSSQLQRLQSTDKLTQKVKDAIDDGTISETAAYSLATMPPEEQDALIESIRRGELDNTVKAVKDERKRREDEQAAMEEEFADEEPPRSPFDEPSGMTEDDWKGPDSDGDEDEDDSSSEEDDASFQDHGSKQTPSQKPERREEYVQQATKPRGFTETIQSELPAAPEQQPDDPQAEAELWFQKSQLIAYQGIYDEANRMKEETEDPVQNAQWGIRAAVALYRLQEFKANMEP